MLTIITCVVLAILIAISMYLDTLPQTQRVINIQCWVDAIAGLCAIIALILWVLGA